MRKQRSVEDRARDCLRRVAKRLGFVLRHDGPRHYGLRHRGRLVGTYRADLLTIYAGTGTCHGLRAVAVEAGVKLVEGARMERGRGT